MIQSNHFTNSTFATTILEKIFGKGQSNSVKFDRTRKN